MSKLFVNLKRFDVSPNFGGICPQEDPVQWIRGVVSESIRLGLGRMPGVELVYFVPESLLYSALEALHACGGEQAGSFDIGCQGVYREDVLPGKNFGAFTSNRPAAAMCTLGCRWTMIGHSEERKDKLELLNAVHGGTGPDGADTDAERAMDQILNAEVNTALNRGMNVLFCIGETAEQKGSNDPAVYEPRVEQVLRRQLSVGLGGLAHSMGSCQVALGYEPVWAIGPGKTPPNADYIGFVSKCIKETCRELFGQTLPVVYGGGLKEENAAEIASVPTIDGGLVALTRFTQPVAFDVASFQAILEKYTGASHENG